MKIYKVEIDSSAREDLMFLFNFLKELKSQTGANQYIDMIIAEVQSLSVFAGLYRVSHFADVLCYHPNARRMVSHNKKWVYIFHIEDDVVVVDRIRPAKMITK